MLRGSRTPTSIHTVYLTFNFFLFRADEDLKLIHHRAEI